MLTLPTEGGAAITGTNTNKLAQIAIIGVIAKILLTCCISIPFHINFCTKNV